MSKKTRDLNTKTARLAAPVRELLRKLIREKIKTEADKRGLATFLERSVSFVNQMIYHGEGGLDAWIGAFSYAYNFDESRLVALFSDRLQAARKAAPQSPADQIWFSLDQKISDEEKFYWASLVQAAVLLERELGLERPIAAKKSSKILSAATRRRWTKTDI